MSFDYKKVSATAGIFCLGGVILLLVNGMDEETIGKFFKKSDNQDTPQPEPETTPQPEPETTPQPAPETTPQPAPVTTPLQDALEPVPETMPPEAVLLEHTPVEATSEPLPESTPLQPADENNQNTQTFSSDIESNNAPVAEEIEVQSDMKGDQNLPSERPIPPLPATNEQSGGTRKQYTSVKKTRRCCKYCNKEQD